jgi:hypothetical protein
MRVAALAVWGLGCFAPGFLVALGRSGSGAGRVHAGTLSQIYGHEMAAYLGYCPASLLTYLLPSLALSPVVLLLLCLGEERPLVSTSAHRVMRVALRLCATWSAMNGLALLALTILSVARNPEAAVVGWALRLWASIVLSGLPSIGLSILIAKSIKSRRAALFVGLLASGAVGFLGILARTLGVLWVPGALDQLLFGGSGGSWIHGALFSAGWLCAWLLAATALAQASAASLARRSTRVTD